MHSACRNLRDHLRVNRRSLLQIGMLGAGLSLPRLLQSEARAAAEGVLPSKEKSVIILWMRGGPSQLEMWDPKPDAPEAVRGEFGVIGTKVPGVYFGEHLPRSAATFDKWSLVRSMHFRKEDGLTDHSSGDQVCFTGYPAGINADQNYYPSVGSHVREQLQAQSRDLPAYVMVPRKVPGTSSAFLGPANEPFETQADPGTVGSPFSVPNMGLLDGLSLDRIESRNGLLKGLDALRREVDSRGTMNAVDAYHQQAWELLTGERARWAFDLDSEPQALRERYGFPQPYTPRMRAGGDRPSWPQRLLLARRLVQAGVRLVTVDCRWWDTHEDNFWALKNGFLPPWDQAFPTLIEDLAESGLLETTMVVAWGEMGRTPRVNANAGRDHWPGVFSVAMAGGGIQGGRVVGSSDHHAAAPKENPKIVQDVLATIYRHLGVKTTKQHVDLAGRPHPVLPCGKAIDELF